MFKIKISLMLMALFFGSITWAADQNYKVHLLTENFPPYNMERNGKNFGKDENIEGIATDIVREMFRRADIDYTLTLRFPWERVYQQVLTKPNFGVFVMSRSAEREDLFKWVGPIGPDDWVLLARNDSTITLQTLEDARQYKIGSYKGDVITEYLENHAIEPTSALRDQENALKLDRGQIDLWATGDHAGRYLAAQEGVRNLKTILRFNRADLYLAFNKETDDAVVAQLQQALDAMRAQGEIEQYFNKYF